MPLDAEMQRLLVSTLRTHAHAAQKVNERERPPPKPAQKPAVRLPPASATGRRAPSRHERNSFFSSNSSKIHQGEAAGKDESGGKGARRAGDPEEDSAEFRSMARAVEELGSQVLGGLAKKDQVARKRAQLALKPAKDQKRPYKQLVELRKKQRKQDAAAADLAREAGNKARRSTVKGGEQERSEERKKVRTDTNIDGNATRNGVLYVPRSLIKDVQFKSRDRTGGGKGSARGGKGGRGGGRGRGIRKGRGKR